MLIYALRSAAHSEARTHPQKRVDPMLSLRQILTENLDLALCILHAVTKNVDLSLPCREDVARGSKLGLY
jgi:hypothetical protein